MSKSKPNSKHPVAGTVRRNVSTVPARPASELNLTKEEIAGLEDPEWVTEDEADRIIADRRQHSPSVPIDDVLRRFGYKRKVEP